MGRLTQVFSENEVDHSAGSEVVHYTLRVESEGDYRGSIIKVERFKTRSSGQHYFAERRVDYRYAQDLSDSQKMEMISLLEERAKTETMPAVLYSARKWAGMPCENQSD